MQEIAWYLTVLLVALAAAVFLYVVAHSGDRVEHERVKRPADRLRTGLFWLLVVVGVIVAGVTLRDLPYAAETRAPVDQVVNVTAHQWYWDIDETELTTGHPVEFRITSDDVNHGFGIYDADTRLVAQAQAMPGYTNRLRHTFDRPGTYRILCLEFCGIGHHAMEAELDVQAP